MNPAHLHLLVNHLPVVGSLFATLLLIVAMVRRSIELQRVALWGIVLVALLAFPAFFTGEGAEEMIEGRPGISHDRIEEHEDFAKIGLIIIEVLGIAAAGGLVAARRADRFPTAYLGAMVLLSVASAATMGVTANLGGQISHPEARSGTALPEGEGHEGEDEGGDGGRGRGRGRGGDH